jgi:TolA-binding protein
MKRESTIRLRLNRTALAVLAVMLPLSAHAQGLGNERVEVEVAPVEVAPETERGAALEEARSGPGAVSASEFEETVDREVIERMGAAQTRLQDLVDNTPVSDTARADYMFRLAELFYDQARFYEQRGFARRDEAFENRATNPQRARAMEENATADIEQADIYANNAIELYAGIYQQYEAVYPDIDAVLYYLGVNLLQVERNEEARVIMETLAASYPRSPYLPQSLLMLGELDFAEGYIDSALRYYTDVTMVPTSSVYPYALYKQAWCLYNLSQGPEDFEGALQGLYNAKLATDERIAAGENRDRLRRDILRDMALFYSEVYPADAAVSFFNELAPDMSFDLIARLARIYGDKGLYNESSTLYRELIALNGDSQKVIEYQSEIVSNTRPSGNEVEIVTELTRLLELYARAATFPDYNAADVAGWGEDIENLVRLLALTYYREAQTTRNEQFHELSFRLFESYLRSFPDSESAYTMWFLYGELLYYHEEQFMEAARAYEQALIRSTGEGQYDEAATYNSCSAYLQMIGMASAQAVESGNAMVSDESELPPLPEPQPITEDYQRMMVACDRYVGTNPTLEDAVQIEFVTAYMYYSLDHLDESDDRMANIVTQYSTVDPARAQTAAILLLDSLAMLRRFDELKTWIDTLKNMPELHDVTLNGGNEFRVQLDQLSESIDFKQCRDMQTSGRSEEAGNCYFDFVEVHYDSAQLDQALYNASIAFEDGNRLGLSLLANQYLIDYAPDSDLVPETTYLLGETYYRMALYSEAADYYEQYVDTAPGGEHVRNALINAATCRRGLGQQTAAIENLRQLIRASDDSDTVQMEAIAASNYEIAEIYREAGDMTRAIAAYEGVIEDFSDTMPDRAMRAHMRIADYYVERGQPDRASQWFQRGVEFWNSVPAERRAAFTADGRDSAARAHFEIGEQIYVEFDAIQLRGDEAAVQAAFLSKTEAAQRAELAFTQVIGIGSPRWSVATFTRVGQMYQVFFTQLIDSPVPDGMTPLEQEVYQEELEARAAVLKEQAMNMYGSAIETARAAGYFSDFAQVAADRYQELDPTFKSGSERVTRPEYSSFSWMQSGYDFDITAPADASETEAAE